MRAAPIRIVLVDMPMLLRELLQHSLANEPDMIVLANEPDIEAVARTARDADADIVIVGLENGHLPEAAQKLLDGHARQKVVGVGTVDGEAALYELQSFRTSIGRASPATLATAIRSAAGNG